MLCLEPDEAFVCSTVFTYYWTEQDIVLEISVQMRNLVEIWQLWQLFEILLKI